MAGLNLDWILPLTVSALALHLASVTFTKALRTYSRSRLEEICAHLGRPERAIDVAHHDQTTERSAESLAVLTGLLLAALLGAVAAGMAPGLAVELVVAIALLIGGLGYVVAGVIGRVFAESVIDSFWPAARPLRTLTLPFTSGSDLVEILVERMARPAVSAPRPASVEVEIPTTDGEDPEEVEAELPESTRTLLQRAVEWTRLDVSELMTPRSAMVCLPSTVSARDAARTFRETGKSRIPLFGENRDDIVGVLYAKDLFPKMTEENPETVIPRTLTRPAYFVPESKNAYELLEELRSKRTQIAVVLDEYGGVAGIVTLEDLLEELVGPIDDEHDVPTPSDQVRALGSHRFEVDAALSLDELNERLHLHLPTDGDFQTVGGFAFHELGRLPEAGTSFRYNGMEFTVVEVAEHMIRRVQLNLEPAEALPSS